MASGVASPRIPAARRGSQDSTGAAAAEAAGAAAAADVTGAGVCSPRASTDRSKPSQGSHAVRGSAGGKVAGREWSQAMLGRSSSTVAAVTGGVSDPLLQADMLEKVNILGGKQVGVRRWQGHTDVRGQMMRLYMRQEGGRSDATRPPTRSGQLLLSPVYLHTMQTACSAYVCNGEYVAGEVSMCDFSLTYTMAWYKPIAAQLRVTCMTGRLPTYTHRVCAQPAGAATLTCLVPVPVCARLTAT